MNYYQKYKKYKTKCLRINKTNMLFGGNDEKNMTIIRNIKLKSEHKIPLPNINQNNLYFNLNSTEQNYDYHLFVREKIIEGKYNEEIFDIANYPNNNNIELLGSGTTSSAYKFEFIIDGEKIKTVKLIILIIEREKERSEEANSGIMIINNLIHGCKYINLCYTYYDGIIHNGKKIITVMEYGGISLDKYIDELNAHIMTEISENKKMHGLENFQMLKSNLSKLYLNNLYHNMIKNFIVQIFGCILTLHTNGILYYDLKKDNFTIMSIPDYKYIKYCGFYLKNEKYIKYEYIVPLNYGLIRIIDYGSLYVEKQSQQINNCTFIENCNYKRVFELFHQEQIYSKYYKDDLNICNIMDIMDEFSKELCQNCENYLSSEQYEIRLNLIIK